MEGAREHGRCSPPVLVMVGGMGISAMAACVCRAAEVAYQVNSRWTGGIRFEWFDDVDGSIVAPTPGPGVYYDLSLGLNYTPKEWLIVRPEIRWDWFDSDTGVVPGPFGDGTKRNQFMAAVDAIVTF